MPLYEHVFIARQDLSSSQAESLMEEFAGVITEQGGELVGQEYWGLRSLAYKVKKNRKGHYGYFRVSAPSDALAELERRERFHEDVLRWMSVRVEEHEEGPSAIITAKNSRDDRRGGRGRDRGDREVRRPREDRPRDDRPRDDRPREDRPRDDAPQAS